MRLRVEIDQNRGDAAAGNGGWQKYCRTCNIWRPPRAAHCGECGVCMVRFESVCVGDDGQRCPFFCSRDAFNPTHNNHKNTNTN